MNVTIEARSVICKVDEALRLVTGPVLIPDTFDLQSESVSADEIRQAAHRYLVAQRNTGIQHGKSKPGIVGEILAPQNNRLEVVESWIVPAGGVTLGTQFLPEGSWVVTMHVLDDAIWADVLSGKLTGFSMGGLAIKKPVEG